MVTNTISISSSATAVPPWVTYVSRRTCIFSRKWESTSRRRKKPMAKKISVFAILKRMMALALPLWVPLQKWIPFVMRILSMSVFLCLTPWCMGTQLIPNLKKALPIFLLRVCTSAVSTWRILLHLRLTNLRFAWIPAVTRCLWISMVSPRRWLLSVPQVAT